MPGTRKLGRTTDHRKAMLRAMVTYLLENGKIETTVTRAKEVRSMAEKMITLAKEPSLHAKRMALAYVTKEDVVKKLFERLPRNIRMSTAATAASLRPARAAATQRDVHHRAGLKQAKNSIIKEKPQVDHSRLRCFYRM